MITALLALVLGLALLVWSAEKFVDGAAGAARHWGMPPLLIGMVVVGFGTSAPEMLVSAMASFQGNPGIALGNAYGSNITNIALILGVTALIKPVAVHSQVLRRELPILALVTALSAALLWDGYLGRLDALVLLAVFAALMAWTIHQGLSHRTDALAGDMARELAEQTQPLGKAVTWMVVGLALLLVSSRLLVWGAVVLARNFGVGDLIIGLTVVAVGTSLPELASSVVAARKGEHDLALGNILGSNLFNTLAVVGIAGVIHPLGVAPEVLARDVSVMAALTLSLFGLGFGFGGPGRINRWEGAALLACYVGYTMYLIHSAWVGQG